MNVPAAPVFDPAFDSAVAALQDHGSIALACHVTPDGDALGSLLAFHLAATSAGKQSIASWPAPFEVAPHYRSVPGLHAAVPAHEFPLEPALMMTFDCGSLGRLNELREPARWSRDHGELIVVDHHVSNECYGSINVIEPRAAATAVVVRDLFTALKWPLTRDIAWCLYTGLVTDTGKFQYAATTPAVFALAEELASFDLPIARIGRELFDEHQFLYLKLAARILERAELDTDISLVSSFVTQQDLAEFKVGYDEVEGMIDWLRTTAEAEVTCMVKEAHDGVRVSLRSKESADVGALAAHFGGGGHRLAAGFSSNESVAEVMSRVKVALRG